MISSIDAPLIYEKYTKYIRGTEIYKTDSLDQNNKQLVDYYEL